MLALLVLATGLRLYRLGDENFWIDEVLQVRVASQPLATIFANYHPAADPGRYQQAPLSLLITHLFLSPSHAEWSARLPSALFGVAGVFSLYLVGRGLFGPPTALLAALLLAISPLDIWYSQEARWYALWALLTTLSYWALLRASRRGGLRAWIAYATLTVLNLYTFLLSFAVAGLQALSAWRLQRAGAAGRGFAVRLAVTLSLLAAAVVPVLAIAATYLTPHPAPARPGTLAALPFTLFAYAMGFSLGPTIADLHNNAGMLSVAAEHPIAAIVLLLALTLLAAGIALAWRTPGAGDLLLPWLGGPFVLAFALALLLNINYRVRYALVALPAFLLLIAAGITSLRSGLLRAAALAALLTCSLWSLANYYWNPRYDKEHVADVLAYVRMTGIAGAPVVTVGEIGVAATYYGLGLAVVSLNDCRAEFSQRDSARLADFHQRPELWLLSGRDWENQTPACRARLASSHETVALRRYPGVDLYQLRRRAPAAAQG